MDDVALAAGQVRAAAGRRDRRRSRRPPRRRRAAACGSIAMPPEAPGSGTTCTTFLVRDRDDPDVVAPAAGRDRPVEAAVRRDRAAGREVPEVRQRPGGLQVAAVVEQARSGPMMPSSAAATAGRKRLASASAMRKLRRTRRLLPANPVFSCIDVVNGASRDTPERVESRLRGRARGVGSVQPTQRR